MSNIIKQIQDNEGNNVLPITHVSAVKDSEGTSLPDILNRDYPTTSKTPVEGSSEVSLVTRGEKFDYDKVNNATDVTGASDIANLKYVLFNGTNEQFKTALDSYVNERIRSAIGSLINNLDKGTGVKAVAGIDNNNDLGTITTANLASLLGVGIVISLPSDQSKVYLGNNTDSIQYELSLWGSGYAIVNSNKNRGISFVVKDESTIIGIEGGGESYLLCGVDSNGHYIHSDGRVTLYPKVQILTEG